MEFYKILENIMYEKNMKISDIAKKTNIPDSTLRSILNRKNKTVALDVAFKISKGLNIDIEELATGKNFTSNIEPQKEISKEKIKQNIINNLNRLNRLGCQKVLERIEELTEVARYTDNLEEETSSDYKINLIISDEDKNNQITKNLGNIKNPVGEVILTAEELLGNEINKIRRAL